MAYLTFGGHRPVTYGLYLHIILESSHNYTSMGYVQTKILYKNTVQSQRNNRTQKCYTVNI